MKKIIINGILIYLLIYSIHLSYASQIKFKHVYDGLSQGSITCLLQDKKGFMWIGTNNGLNRYDGIQFKIYENQYNDSTSLSDNKINTLYEDEAGALWIGTSLGLNRYDDTHDRFIRYQISSDKPAVLYDNYIQNIFKDRNNRLWIATGSGINRLDAGSNHFVLYDTETGLRSNYIDRMIIDHSGTIWAASRGGYLHYYDSVSDTFVPHKSINTKLNSLGVDMIRDICPDNRGNLWLATYSKGLIVLSAGGDILHYEHEPDNPGSLAHNAIISLLFDHEGNLWVGTENYGLDLLRNGSGVFTHFNYNPNDSYSLSSNSIYALFEDRNGLLWVGTFHTGINVIDPYEEKFDHYQHIANYKNSLSNNVVTSFQEDDQGNYWIGTDGGGLNYFNRAGRSFTHYRQVPGGLKSNAILSLCYDNKNNLWIGTWAGGINIFNHRNGFFNYFNSKNSNLESNNIYSIIRSTDGKMYIGTNGGGLSIFDDKNRRFTTFRNDRQNEYSISSDDIRFIYQDRTGDIWIATYSNGINRLDKDEKGAVIFTQYTMENTQLSDNHITTLFEDASSNFWVGTYSGGLNLMDRKTGACRIYRKEQGLINNMILGILEDTHGNLWISTGNGLCKFNPDSGNFRSFNLSDGLQGREFSLNASFKIRDGEFLFGGKNGFNLFDPEFTVNNPYKPPVYITNLKIFNKSINANTPNSPLKKSIQDTRELELSYKQSFISIEYVGINFTHGDENKYAYKLEGLEYEWNYVGSQRLASYSNLRPGTYRFRIKAANNDNLWNEKGTDIKIVILPPFWDTWWFRTIIILLVIGSIYLWYYTRMRRVKRMNRALEQKVRERTHELQERTDQLNHKTEALVTAKKETDDILQNVDEGLFLIDREYNIASQYARVLETIFERKKLAQIPFFNLLKGNIDINIFSTTYRYLNLMFKQDVDEETLIALNPLKEIKVNFEETRSKYLSFKFGRIFSTNGEISELIVTVRDVTDQVLLTQKLQSAEEKTSRQINWLLSVLHVEPDRLNSFIQSVQEELDLIDTLLKSEDDSSDFETILNQVFRSMHSIKGNASLLALNFFADEAHKIEDKILEIQNVSEIESSDMDAVAEAVNIIRMNISEVHRLLERISTIHAKMRAGAN